MESGPAFLKGVNLGGWLVLERWITPSLFDGLSAWDESAFSEELGSGAKARFEEHRRTFIKKSDFEWLAKHGVNAVRLPVGHWVFNDVPPFVGAIEYVDKAFEYARESEIKVLLELHGAPGSQNGFKHSGKEGGIGWHKDSQNITKTLSVIERLAERYGNSPALWGIGLLNEPQKVVPLDLLTDYYRRGYEIVRKHAGGDVAVVISDGFRPLSWGGAMPADMFQNVILDTHLYQVFSWRDKKQSFAQLINKTSHEWDGLLDQIQRSLPALVGEWSVALHPNAANTADRGSKEAHKRYTEAQLQTFSKARGWFYWTYKTESLNAWNFRHCIEQGWIRLT